MFQASGLSLTLSEDDLNEFLNELPQPAELSDLRLSLGEDLLSVRFTLRKLGFNIPLHLEVRVLEARPYGLRLGVSIANLGVLPAGLKDFGLHKTLDSLQLDGVSYSQGELLIVSDEALAMTPLRLELQDLRVAPDGLRVSLASLRYLPVVAPQAEDVSEVPLPPVMPRDPAAATGELQLPGHQEFYDRLKGRVLAQADRRLPARLRPLIPWLLLVPDSFALMVRLLRDKRVPRRSKWIAAIAVAYFIDPLDLIPDVIPVLGQLDDLAVAIFALESLLADTPEDVLRELWPGEGDVISAVREGVRFFSRYLTGGAVGRIRSLLARKPPSEGRPEAEAASAGGGASGGGEQEGAGNGRF